MEGPSQLFPMKKQLTKKILLELSEIPNVSLICKKLSISRQTFYRWKKENPEFNKAVDESLEYGIESISDLAESKLIENIKNGKQRSIEYWLNNNKKKYFRPRPVINITDRPIPILGNEERKHLMSLLDK